MQKTINYEYLDLKISPVWNAARYFREESVSFDGGKTYELVFNQLLFGTYFFLDTEMVVHSRNACQWWEVLSDFGGLFDIFYLTLAFFGCYINDKLIMNKLIKNFYNTREKTYEAKLSKQYTQSNQQSFLKRASTFALVDSIHRLKFSSYDIIKTWFVDKFGTCFKRIELNS